MIDRGRLHRLSVFLSVKTILTSPKGNGERISVKKHVINNKMD